MGLVKSARFRRFGMGVFRAKPKKKVAVLLLLLRLCVKCTGFVLSCAEACLVFPSYFRFCSPLLCGC